MIDHLRKDLRDFLLLQYFDDLSENPKLLNSLNNIMRQRFKELTEGNRCERFSFSESRIEQILDFFAGNQDE